MDNKKEVDSKLPYEKPALRTIQLAAEEVLVTKCKNSPATKTMGPPGCGHVSCSAQGLS